MRFRHLLSAPVYADEEQARKAKALHFVIWSILLVINSHFYVALFALPYHWAHWVAILLTIDFTLPVLLLLNRRGFGLYAGILLLTVLWVLATILAFISRGFHAPVLLTYFINALIAGVLFGGRGGIIAGIVFCLTIIGLVQLGVAELLPRNNAIYTTLSIWVSLTIFFELIVVYLFLNSQSHQAALKQANETHKKLRLSHGELEARIQERTVELQRINKELESFSYSVSHDLRRPLRGVVGFSDLLMEEHAEELSPAARELVVLIKDSAAQMNVLIEALLYLSRVDRQPLIFRRVDLTALVHKVVAELQAEKPGRQMDIRVADLPDCQGDPALLRQVFINLLSNAMKFTRTRPMAVIEVGYKSEGTEVIYFVRDNGVGFDMRHADRLFGVFQRLHSADEFPGTGVGLSIVQRIIHRHGGKIWAESVVGQDATFYFTLPRPEQKQDQGEKEDAQNT